MAAGVVWDAVGVYILGGAAEGVLAEAHDPSEQELAGGAIGGFGEGRADQIDDGVEGSYHSPHGGTSQSLETFHTVKDTRNPLPFHPAGLRHGLALCSDKTANVQLWAGP